MVESSGWASGGLASRSQPRGVSERARRSTSTERLEFVVSASEYGSVTTLVTTSSSVGT